MGRGIVDVGPGVAGEADHEGVSWQTYVAGDDSRHAVPVHEEIPRQALKAASSVADHAVVEGTRVGETSAVR